MFGLLPGHVARVMTMDRYAWQYIRCALPEVAASAELESAILAVPAYSGWLNTDLQARGIDVNDAQVAGLIGTIVSAPTAAAIVAAGVVVVPKYAGLKIGHLANARQQRAAGEV